MPDLNLSRPLGAGEHLWWRLSQLNSTNYVTVSHIKGRLDPKRMKKALEELIQAYPILRAKITLKDHKGKKQQKPYFVFQKGLPQMLTTTRLSDEDAEERWQATAEQEANLIVRHDANPLWRAQLLLAPNTAYFIMTNAHVIGDGQSASTMLESLFKAYQIPGCIEPTEHNPAYESVLNRSPYLSKIRNILSLSNRILANSRGEFLSLPRVEANQAAEPAATEFMIRSLSEMDSKCFMAACKSHKSKIGGVVSGTMLLAVHEEIGTKEAARMVLTSAINVRPHLNKDFQRYSGYFVSGLESVYEVERNKDIWQLSDEVTLDQHQQLNSEQIGYGLLLRRLLLRFKRSNEKLLQTIRKNNRSSLHISNLGQLNMSTDFGDIEVCSHKFFASVHVIPNPMLMMVTYSFNHRMEFIFAYSKPFTDKTRVEAIIKNFMNRLVSFSAEGPHLEASRCP